MTDEVQSTVRRAFPDRDVRSVSEPPSSAHRGNRTLEVRFEGGERAYLKVRIDGDAERNAREAAVTRYAGRHAGVRVPAVLAADSAADPPYFATAPLDGRPFADEWRSAAFEDRITLARVIGHVVALISSATVADPGWIVGGDEAALDVEGGPWSAVLADAVRRRAAEVPYADRFDDVPGRVADVLRDAAVLDGAPTTLVHCDVRPANVFLGAQDDPRDSVTPGVIDWEWSLAGDPALGICWAESRVVERADVPEDRQDRLRTAVHRGYRDVAGDLPPGFDRRRPFYRVVTFLPKAQTFDLWAPDAPEPTDDLAAWVRAELDDRIATAIED